MYYDSRRVRYTDTPDESGLLRRLSTSGATPPWDSPYISSVMGSGLTAPLMGGVGKPTNLKGLSNNL